MVLRFGRWKWARLLTEMVKAQHAEEKMPLRKGAWTPEEDKKLTAYIKRYGIWNWSQMPKPAGKIQVNVQFQWIKAQSWNCNGFFHFFGVLYMVCMLYLGENTLINLLFLSYFFLLGLARSGKSCRLRWMNYLRPDIKRGNFSKEEEETILKCHEELGNR